MRPEPPASPGTPRATAVGTACAVLAFAAFAATVSPTVTFGDAGELIAASASLGVPHPPGYPLYTLLARAALAVPLGGPALRVNLLSAVAGALACGLFAALLARLAGTALAAAGALALAFSATFWAASTGAEVYTVHLALMAALLLAAATVGSADDARVRARAATLGGAMLGLGLAHHPTIVLALPAAAALAAAGERAAGWRRWLPDVSPARLAGAAALAVGVAAALDATLLVRAGVDAPVHWLRPGDPAALWDHVRAAAYRHLDLGWSGLARGASWARLGAVLAGEATPLALPLAAIGAFGRLRPSDPARFARARRAAILLVVAGAAFGLRYVTDDVEVFFLPAVVGVVALAGLGVATLAATPVRGARAAAATAAVALVVAPFAAHVESRSLRGFTAAEDYARDVLATVPPGGVLFASTDDAFPVLYVHAVLGERPDVTVHDTNGRLFRDLAREAPVPRRPGESASDWRVRVEQAWIDREMARPDRRAIAFLGWPGYDVPPRYRLEPVGLVWRLSRASDPPLDASAPWAGYRGERVRAQAERTGDGIALAMAAVYPLARGERALYEGDEAEARRRFDEVAERGAASADLVNYVGTLYARRRDWPRAIAWFRRAVDSRPSLIGAWNNLGRALALAGDRDGAREAYRRSLEVAPDQSEAREALRDLDGAR